MHSSPFISESAGARLGVALTPEVFMTRNIPARPIRFHRFSRSGHCHRVELLLSLLELPVEVIDVNLAAREHKAPAFLARNPFGQVPVIEDEGVTLADSIAILVYLAGEYGGTRWLPASAARAAEQQRWFSVAQGPLAFGPALARGHYLFKSPADLQAAQARAHALFGVMNAHLRDRPFLLGAELGLADLANYAYIAHAPEGGVSLDEYSAIRGWLSRIEATPGFVPMPKSPHPDQVG
jgi:glutathione S-transferase